MFGVFGFLKYDKREEIHAKGRSLEIPVVKSDSYTITIYVVPGAGGIDVYARMIWFERSGGYLWSHGSRLYDIGWIKMDVAERRKIAEKVVGKDGSPYLRLDLEKLLSELKASKCIKRLAKSIPEKIIEKDILPKYIYFPRHY